MQLSEIIGDKVLEIVPNVNVRHPIDPDASGVLFTLSGTTFLLFEDPNDGYRSSCGPVMSFEGSAYEIGGDGWHPIYIREDVVCRHLVEDEGNECNILEVVSVETGKVVLRVGTENTDDYYPGFVCTWSPENLSVNAKTRAHD